jgi:hypothetical protein
MDRQLYVRQSSNTPPERIHLDPDCRCSCGTSRSPDFPTTWGRCQVFTLQRSYIAEIELQVCPARCYRARHRFVGADAAYLGLFNLNNRFLFAHDLLDDYTLCFSTSETPFAAWVFVTATRYQLVSNSPFVSEAIFREAWFAYARLQCFEGDMVCPICGPKPARVIFDGITLAFGRKHLTETLKPPTSIDGFSPIRRCKPVKQQMALPDKALRALVRKVIAGPFVVTEKKRASANVQDSDDSDGEPTGAPGQAGNSKVLKEVIECVRVVPKVLEGLYLVNTSLGNLFQKYFGAQNLESGGNFPGELVSLFREVGTWQLSMSVG